MVNNLKSKIIIGVWSLSGDYGKVKKKNINLVIKECLKRKFFEFDTAPTYGRGRIDKILSKFKKKYKKIKINTKCGYNPMFKKTFKIKDIKNSIDNSLKLYENLNHIYLHNPRKEIKNWERTIKVLQEYKKKGLIKKIGISLARDYFFERKIINKFDVLMDELNLLRTENFKRIGKINPKLVVRSAFANGLLTKKKITKLKLSKNDHRKIWLDKDRMKSIDSQLKLISNKFKKDLKILSLSLIFSLKKVDKIIIGVKSVKHLKWLDNNLKNIKKLKEKEIKYILEINKKKFFLNKNLVY